MRGFHEASEYKCFCTAEIVAVASRRYVHGIYSDEARTAILLSLGYQLALSCLREPVKADLNASSPVLI